MLGSVYTQPSVWHFSALYILEHNLQRVAMNYMCMRANNVLIAIKFDGVYVTRRGFCTMRLIQKAAVRKRVHGVIIINQQ